MNEGKCLDESHIAKNPIYLWCKFNRSLQKVQSVVQAKNQLFFKRVKTT